MGRRREIPRQRDLSIPVGRSEVALRAWKTIFEYTTMREVEGQYEVLADVPGFDGLTVLGSSPADALFQLSSAVSEVVKKSEPRMLIDWLSPRLVGRVEPAKDLTKSRMRSIGVNARSSLFRRIESRQGEFLAEKMRECFLQGFRKLDERLFLEDASTVLGELDQCYRSFDGDSQTKMLRLDPKAYGRAIIRAREHGLSASKLAVLCMSDTVLK